MEVMKNFRLFLDIYTKHIHTALQERQKSALKHTKNYSLLAFLPIFLSKMKVKFTLVTVSLYEVADDVYKLGNYASKITLESNQRLGRGRSTYKTFVPSTHPSIQTENI